LAKKKKERIFVFEVMFNLDFEPRFTGISTNFDKNQRHSRAAAITLDSCFKAFEQEELLTGQD